VRNPTSSPLRITGMTSRHLTFMCALVGAFSLVSGCASSGDETESSEAPAVTDAVTPALTEGDVDADQDAVADADGDVDVSIERSRFSETRLFVEVGETVVFENRDEFVHTVTSTDASAVEFDSGGLEQGERFEIAFDAPGEYAYYCQVHPTMRGVVIVG
jgi:plastocyanin